MAPVLARDTARRERTPWNVKARLHDYPPPAPGRYYQNLKNRPEMGGWPVREATFGSGPMKICISPSEFKNLAPFPSTMVRLTHVMNDPNSTMSEITRLIELDAALTINVLKWANSAFFHSQHKAESVRVAVVRLGVNNIIRLAVGNFLLATLDKSLPAYGLDQSGLWRHNLVSALAVEALEPYLRQPPHSAAFTAALLHDVGKFILGQHLDGRLVAELHRITAEEGLTFFEAERRLLETNHAEVGAAMANYWKFPDDLVRGIARHHDPDPRPNALLDVVQIANAIAKLMDGRNGLAAIPGDGLAILRRQGLDPDQLADVCEAVRRKWQETEIGDNPE